jgi:hypothetical protein
VSKRNKGKVIPLFKAEPAMVRAVVMVLGLLAWLGFGWAADVDQETITSVAIVAGLLVPIVQGLWTRFVVTPSAQVAVKVTPSGRVIAGDAAVEPTGTEVDQPQAALGHSRPGGGPEYEHVSRSARTVAAVVVKPQLVRPPAA